MMAEKSTKPTSRRFQNRNPLNENNNNTNSHGFVGIQQQEQQQKLHNHHSPIYKLPNDSSECDSQIWHGGVRQSNPASRIANVANHNQYVPWVPVNSSMNEWNFY